MKSSIFFATAFLALSAAFAKDFNSGGETFTSGGTCVAHADAGVWKEAESAAGVAIAKAVAIGCTAYSVDKLVRDIEQQVKVFAVALVKVHAHAASKCSTFGKTSFGCAAAIGHADGQTRAVIALLSKAYAKAINNCKKCDPVLVKAKTFNIAALVVKLTAQASATAKAAVCVGPNQTAKAEAYVKCVSAIWAHGCAYALAKAMISGGCTHLSADAITTVNNMIETDPYCACKIRASTSSGSLKWYKEHAPFTYAAFKAECATDANQIV